jgi:DNA (cytosine-5)-methyltransferase 1
MGLASAVKIWPTPNASDHIQRKTSKSWAQQGRVNYVLSNPEITGVTGGALNPMWVEWLMGWPLGWTDLKPLEMDKCQFVPQQPGDI